MIRLRALGLLAAVRRSIVNMRKAALMTKSTITSMEVLARALVARILLRSLELVIGLPVTVNVIPALRSLDEH